MHLILALSVIILQHVDSYSCRSILRTLDDLNSKSVEDSSESYELRNEDILELLQPFLEPKPEEVIERQQLQKNLAKLTIEPYLKKNRTRNGQRNPFSNLNKRKTIAPLAIILTNLPDLKLKQTDNKIKNEKSVNENVNEDNLYADSKDVSNNILHHLIKADKQQQNSDEITNIDNDKDENISPQLKSNDETLKPVTSKKVKITTGSPDPVSIQGKDLNNSENNEDEDTVKTEIENIMEQLANEGISNEIARLTEGVEMSIDDYSSDGYTLYLTGLESKDLIDSAEDKLQKVVDEVSEAHDTPAEDKRLSGELILHDLDAGDMDEEKLIDEEDYDRINNSLEIMKPSLDFVRQKLKLSNRDIIIPDSNNAQSNEDDTENVFASYQEHLHNLQKDIVLEEGPNKKDAIETLNHQKRLQSPEESIVLESSGELSKEYDKHKPQNNRKYLHIVLKEDEDKENPLVSPQQYLHNVPEHILLETDVELSKEDIKEKSIKDHQKHLHSLHEMHKNPETWYHDIDNGHSSYTHKIYNLYFRFK